MLHLCLVLILSASVFSESVRETETWMPMKTTQTAALSTRDVESSGDSQNGSDFGFTDDGEDDDDDDYYTDSDEEMKVDDEDDYEEYEEFSGSGDGETSMTPERDVRPSLKPDADSNKIPELERPARPTVNEVDLVKNSNEIPLLGNEAELEPSNVLMSHHASSNIFDKTEVLAAVIAGCAVCLMLAVLLTLFLIYRMKKKDEGSYDLGKKPIYKKAPTTEIYA